jgi:hypothetical protein
MNEVFYNRMDEGTDEEMDEVAYLFEPRGHRHCYGFRWRLLKETSFMYCYNYYGAGTIKWSQWMKLGRERINDKYVVFEYVLDNSPANVQEELLFHLDFFLGLEING